MADTSPSRSTPPSAAPAGQPLDEYQPIRVGAGKPLPDIKPGQHRRPRWGRWIFALLILLVLAYFLVPFRTNVLILGVDDSAARGPVGRSDTMILATFTPYYTGILGMPRDLWLNIPGVGPQRINTAYFFAEARQRGTGAPAAVEMVRKDFGLTVDHYVVLHMDGLEQVVDALGGLDITLTSPQAGLPAGTHHLDGTQALAFARERYSADDFARLRQGQILIVAALKKLLSSAGWNRIVPTAIAASQALETDIPAWLYPRLGLALLRAALFGLDGRMISREMVLPFTTDQGAQVLSPNWDAINPVLKQMFGQ